MASSREGDGTAEGTGKSKAPLRAVAEPVKTMPGKEAFGPPLPRRFYKKASVEAAPRGFRILLDGRPVKTPKKNDLAVPTRAFAEAIAEEWRTQGEHVDPRTMPLTRLANVTIDAVAAEAAAVAADMQAFAGSDLLCYRASAPEGLVQRQHAHWDPVLAWAKSVLGAEFEAGEGVVPVKQSDEALAAIGRELKRLDPYRLASLHVMTTLTGSVILALAHMQGRLTLDQTWSAAHVDEHWQIEHWGRDAEADARERIRRSEFEAASRLLSLLD